jgi:hypothetical protein
MEDADIMEKLKDRAGACKQPGKGAWCNSMKKKTSRHI